MKKSNKIGNQIKKVFMTTDVKYAHNKDALKLEVVQISVPDVSEINKYEIKNQV